MYFTLGYIHFTGHETYLACIPTCAMHTHNIPYHTWFAYSIQNPFNIFTKFVQQMYLKYLIYIFKIPILKCAYSAKERIIVAFCFKSGYRALGPADDQFVQERQANAHRDRTKKKEEKKERIFFLNIFYRPISIGWPPLSVNALQYFQPKKYGRSYAAVAWFSDGGPHWHQPHQFSTQMNANLISAYSLWLISLLNGVLRPE